MIGEAVAAAWMWEPSSRPRAYLPTEVLRTRGRKGAREERTES